MNKFSYDNKYAYIARKKTRVGALQEKRKRETAEERAPEDAKKKSKIMKKHMPYTPILALEK